MHACMPKAAGFAALLTVASVVTTIASCYYLLSLRAASGASYCTNNKSRGLDIGNAGDILDTSTKENPAYEALNQLQNSHYKPHAQSAVNHDRMEVQSCPAYDTITKKI